MDTQYRKCPQCCYKRLRNPCENCNRFAKNSHEMKCPHKMIHATCFSCQRCKKKYELPLHFFYKDRYTHIPFMCSCIDPNENVSLEHMRMLIYRMESNIAVGEYVEILKKFFYAGIIFEIYKITSMYMESITCCRFNEYCPHRILDLSQLICQHRSVCERVYFPNLIRYKTFKQDLDGNKQVSKRPIIECNQIECNRKEKRRRGEDCEMLQE